MSSVSHDCIKKRIMIISTVCILFSSALLLCIRLTIFFAGNIAGAFEPALAEILSAWRSAVVDTPIILSILCGAVFSFAEYALITRAKRSNIACAVVLYISAVLLAVILFLISFIGLLFMTTVNQIPLPAFVKSAIRVVSLL